jgi:hypothetical protein
MVGGLVKDMNRAQWLVVKVVGLLGMISSHNATNMVQTFVNHKYIHYLTSHTC